MENLLSIGAIVKPQGIKGELKVLPYTDDVLRFKKLKEVIIEGKIYKVINAKIADQFVILQIEGVYDRNTSELFRGKFLHVQRKDAIVPKENSFFIVDVIGSRLITENGKEVGIITDVTSAKTDVITVKCSNGVMRFPFLKDLLVSFDANNKIMTVLEKRLSEVSCYED